MRVASEIKSLKRLEDDMISYNLVNIMLYEVYFFGDFDTDSC